MWTFNEHLKYKVCVKTWILKKFLIENNSHLFLPKYVTGRKTVKEASQWCE